MYRKLFAKEGGSELHIPTFSKCRISEGNVTCDLYLGLYMFSDNLQQIRLQI